MSTSVKPADHTPTSLKDGSHISTPKKIANPQTTAAIALNMSWQLLIVIIVPLYAGFWLDNHFNTNNVWMIVGMVVAAVSMILVVRQTVRQLNLLNNTDEDES